MIAAADLHAVSVATASKYSRDGGCAGARLSSCRARQAIADNTGLINELTNYT